MIPADFADLWGTDRDRRNAAYQSFMDATTEPVPWAHDVWPSPREKNAKYRKKYGRYWK